MPYFERKPYADLEAVTNQAAQASAGPAVAAGANDSLLLRQAAEILREQSRSLPDWRAAQPGGPKRTGLDWQIPAMALPPPLGSPSSVLGYAAAPVILTAAPAKAGQQVRVPISLINDSTEDVPCAIQFTDLVSIGGDRIPSTAVSWIRQASSVPAGEVLNADIGIEIPRTPPGEYCGVMACRDALPAILTVIVSG